MKSTTQSGIRFPVLSVGINAISREETFQQIKDWIEKNEPHYVSVCSVQTVLDCYDSADLTRIVNSSGIAVPDGMPLVWIGKHFGHSIERVYGPDLVLDVCERGQDLGYRHFLYGGGPGIAERMSEKLRKRYPRLQIVGTCSPPFHDMSAKEDEEAAKLINQASPDIVWCGLGTPKQDYWISRMRGLLRAPVLISVGAAFDLHSGRIRQAPTWMRKAGLEWSFRLLMEPRRLWRRYLFGNPRFLYLLFRQLLRQRGRSLPPNGSGNSPS